MYSSRLKKIRTPISTKYFNHLDTLESDNTYWGHPINNDLELRRVK